MKASVVITSFNDDHRLGLTLWGWAGQTDRRFELTVVNDGGNEPVKTLDLVSGFRKYMDVRYCYLGPSKRELGEQVFRLSQARNVGIRESSGDLLVISDCDTIPAPDLIATLIGKARDDRILIGIRKRIGMNHVEALTRDDLFQLPTLVYRDDDRLVNPAFARVFLSLKDTAPYGSWALCWGCIFAAPLRKVKEIGGFDERFVGWGAEDEDLAERLVRGTGCRLLALPEAVVYHLDHPPRDPHPYKADRILAEIRANYTHVRNNGPIL